MAYNEGTTPDFFLVELRDGQLRVGVDDGSAVTRWRGRGRLDDGQWHLLELFQNTHKKFTVSIDDGADDVAVGTLAVPDKVDRRNVFDMFGPLYVGGLPAHMRQSRRPHGLQGSDDDGFVGCLATLTVNGVLYDRTASLPPAAVSGCRSKYDDIPSILCTKQQLLYRTL